MTKPVSLPAWAAQRPLDEAIDILAGYCAPTALAALMGCTRREAAETLLAVPGMLHRRRGAVSDAAWHRWLVKELGLVHTSTERSLEEREADVARRRERGGWEHGEYARYITRTNRYGWDYEVRQERPNIHDRVSRYPTVAQWLAANPTAEGILSVDGHTLYVRGGEVVGDTLTTKSMRRRVDAAYLTP